MQYNSTRKKLIIPEYGRSVQQLVDHCKTIKDKEERNKFAKAIVDVLGNLNTHLRDVPEFQHKIWDQLFIMAEFDLDVDCPFPKPLEEEIKQPPRRIPYPEKSRDYRYYGTNIKKIIALAKSYKDKEKKNALAVNIANQMKKTFIKLNKDQVTDQTIFEQLKKLSNNDIDLTKSDEILIPSQEIRAQLHTPNKHKPRKRNGKR